MGVLLLVGLLSGADLDRVLLKELTRLESSMNAIDAAKLPNDLAYIFKVSRDGLDRARASKSPLVRLYRLRQPYVAIETLIFFNDHRDDLSSFTSVQKTWNARKPAFEKQWPAARGNLVVRALQQAALNRGQKLFRASLPYGKADGPFGGLYYLAEAEGNLRFRDFVARLSDDESEAPPKSAAIANALRVLETDAIGLFEKDPASRTAIPSSAALKEARELYDRKFVEGATLLVLESQLELSKRHKTASKRAASTQRDDSMASLWKGIQQEEQSAEVRDFIRLDVMPLYSSLFTSGLAPAVATKTVKVRFVRWPYT